MIYILDFDTLNNIFVFILLGIGYGMVIISAIVCVYYNIIITWTLYYLFQSFSRVLPWSTCGNSWNTDRCVTQHDNVQTNHSLFNYTTNSTDGLYEEMEPVNITYTLNETVKYRSSSEEYWE